MARFVDDLSIRLARRIGRRGLLSAAGGALAGLGFGARPRSTLAQRPRRRRYPFRMRVTGRVTSPLDPSCFTGATPCRTVVTGEGTVHRLGAVFVTAESTFVVDPEGTIQHVYVTNLNVGRAPADTLRVLDALQTDELCPCNRPVGGDVL